MEIERGGTRSHTVNISFFLEESMDLS